MHYNSITGNQICYHVFNKTTEEEQDITKYPKDVSSMSN
jgi:hypothetical protein